MPDIERSSVAKVIDRIVADNDPRNGTTAQRLVRMLEQPDRQPDADGLYPEVKRLRSALEAIRARGGHGEWWDAARCAEEADAALRPDAS